jgi:hypothetical protein
VAIDKRTLRGAFSVAHIRSTRIHSETILTTEDLREAVETYGGAVPTSFGHQMAKEEWSQSFGLILTVELKEQDDGEQATLVGDVKMNELLSDAYDKGLYTGRSISLPARASDGTWFIHHLAILGAVPPKIKLQLSNLRAPYPGALIR